MQSDREWLIWYRNWLCNEHNARLVIPAQVVVGAIDHQLGEGGRRKADQELAEAGRPSKEQIRADIADQRPEWYVKALEKAGDNLAHQFMYKQAPEQMQAWWDARDGKCTYCGDAEHTTRTVRTEHPEWFDGAYQKLADIYNRDNFWRCAHYQSAIDNHFATRTVCDYAACHLSELRWYHNGCKPATS